MKVSAEKAVEILKLTNNLTRFDRRRKALRAEGMSLKAAKDHALSEFMPVIEAYYKAQLAEPTTPGGDAVVGAPDEAPSPRYQEPPATKQPKDIATRQGHLKFVKKEASIVEQVKWVAKHLDVDIELIDVKDIPCAEAWGMLNTYRVNEERKREFWDKLYPKLIPSRGQLEAGKGGVMDGQHIVETIDRIREILKRIGAEDEAELSALLAGAEGPRP